MDNIDTIMDKILDLCATGMTSEYGPQIAELKTIATKFLAKYNAFESVQERARGAQRVINQTRKKLKAQDFRGGSPAELTRMLQDARDQRAQIMYNDQVQSALFELYNLAHEFQGAATKLVGVKIHMAFVINGMVIDISDIPLEELMHISHESATGTLKLQFSYDSNFMASKLAGRRNLADFSEDSEEMQTAAQGIQNIYNEIRRRRAIAKRKSSPYLLYKPNGTWIAAKIAGGGDVNEAYANAMLQIRYNDQAKNIISKISGMDIEHGIEYFVHSWIQQVDNAPGLLTEDVEINESEYYGIKGLNASIASLGPYVKLAQAIVGAPEALSATDLKATMRATSSGEMRNKVVGAIQDSSIDDLAKTIPKHQKITVVLRP